MKDRTIGLLALVVAVGALYYGWEASRQNKKIIEHTKALKETLKE